MYTGMKIKFTVRGGQYFSVFCGIEFNREKYMLVNQ